MLETHVHSPLRPKPVMGNWTAVHMEKLRFRVGASWGLSPKACLVDAVTPIFYRVYS